MTEEERLARKRKYYETQKAKRQSLAAERRKIRKRTTTAKMPTAEMVRTAWEERAMSVEAMIRFGGMLHDLECFVDNSLVKDGDGEIVGRQGGIREWLDENLHQLTDSYRAMMNYKSIVKKIRQVMRIEDPQPTEAALVSGALRPLLEEIESEEWTHPGIGRFEAVNVVLTRRLKKMEGVTCQSECHEKMVGLATGGIYFGK